MRADKNRVDIPDPTPLDEAIWALYVEMRKSPEGAPLAFAQAVGRLFPVRMTRLNARKGTSRYYASHREERRAYGRSQALAYNAAHRGERAAYYRAYAASHREERRRSRAAHRAARQVTQTT